MHWLFLVAIACVVFLLALIVRNVRHRRGAHETSAALPAVKGDAAYRTEFSRVLFLILREGERGREAGTGNYYVYFRGRHFYGASMSDALFEATHFFMRGGNDDEENGAERSQQDSGK